MSSLSPELERLPTVSLMRAYIRANADGGNGIGAD